MRLFIQGDICQIVNDGREWLNGKPFEIIYSKDEIHKHNLKYIDCITYNNVKVSDYLYNGLVEGINIMVSIQNLQPLNLQQIVFKRFKRIFRLNGPVITPQVIKKKKKKWIQSVKSK